jgi:hypothetical protein
MKLKITGASNFVNRMFEACGSYQWAREFLKNSMEAGASKVEFGIEWQAVHKHGTYRRIVADDGAGMDRDQLLRFFSTLGDGGKRIAGVHDNFGVGAKIAALPWNPEGLVVISRKNGAAAMIWIVLDPDSGDYELVEFTTGNGKTCVIEPTEIEGIDWATVGPEWTREHGTVVVLLGSEQYPDTVLGNPEAGETDIKGLSVYLNHRFWDLSAVDVRVVELRSERKTQWPQDEEERDDARRPNRRQIMGARYYLTDIANKNGKLREAGVVLLDAERVTAEWYLWEGERPSVHSYAKEKGYVAVRYKDELFQLTQNKAHFRWFGVVEAKVQQNLTIILEPQHFEATNGRWGVHPDQSRNRLIFSAASDKGVEIPLSDWGHEFAGQMPDAILQAIREARGDLSASIENEDYRKRLQDRFGNRWTVKKLVLGSGKDLRLVKPTDNDVEVYVGPEPDPKNSRSRKKRRKSIKIVHRRAVEGGEQGGIEREAPVDVPRIRFAHREEFNQPWHLALWSPNDPDGPCVCINLDSPILQEAVEYHQQQYLDVFAEQVAETVRQVFGEVAACKVAHSQKLAKDVPEQELDRDYRSEQALTLALMGLMAEEAVIGQRLIKLGRKKQAA